MTAFVPPLDSESDPRTREILRRLTGGFGGFDLRGLLFSRLQDLRSRPAGAPASVEAEIINGMLNEMDSGRDPFLPLDLGSATMDDVVRHVNRTQILNKIVCDRLGGL